MNVTDQLATLADTLSQNGYQSLKPGIWRAPNGGYAVRTGYVMGEVTFWVEDERGKTIPSTYYRGDDLLSFLVTGHAEPELKNLGKKIRKTLDSRSPLP